MFLETKKSGLYLGKKFQGKTFLVKINKETGITQGLLERLTIKECEYLKTKNSYMYFSSEMYNEKLLEEVLFLSKFLSNNIEILEILEKLNPQISKKRLSEKLTKDEVLYKQGAFFKGWLNNTFYKKFIFNSNNIEGSRIPEAELEKILENKKYSYKIQNEVQEVINSKKSWDFLQSNFSFNIGNVKKLYHILTKNLFQTKNGLPYPRGFKKVPIIVGINESTTPPEKVESEMQQLIDTYKASKKDTFSLQLAFDFHLKYEQIHPFEDGNGRTGRLLMNKILLQSDMVPMIVFAENKESYSSSIASCNSGRKKKYYKFMLEQYKKTLENLYEFEPGLFKKYLGKQ